MKIFFILKTAKITYALIKKLFINIYLKNIMQFAY